MAVPTSLVKVSYSRESLTPKEIEKGALPYTISIFFYANDDQQTICKRLEKAWRPGATATIYSIESKVGVELPAGSKKSWLRPLCSIKGSL